MACAREDPVAGLVPRGVLARVSPIGSGRGADIIKARGKEQQQICHPPSGQRQAWQAMGGRAVPVLVAIASWHASW
eukprot:COSAG04_NODE_568_length_12543_cov_31.893282_3_plen_76_part_00